MLRVQPLLTHYVNLAMAKPGILLVRMPLQPEFRCDSILTK